MFYMKFTILTVYIASEFKDSNLLVRRYFVDFKNTTNNGINIGLYKCHVWVSQWKCAHSFIFWNASQHNPQYNLRVHSNFLCIVYIFMSLLLGSTQITAAAAATTTTTTVTNKRKTAATIQSVLCSISRTCI